MVQYTTTLLDDAFGALSDATRRGVLEHLGHHEASITDLAHRFQMTLTGMSKHICILEQAGLVVSEKVGRVRICRVGPRHLEEAATWLEQYRRLWEARFTALDEIVEELTQKEQSDGHELTK
ncbi:MAG TPA: metalloregulator ArsR/SmtB family transcription factor [Arachnia sp.]|nr:metalloregulator ArsR/SmtB family transcription factor [Arachnia sp.]HMT86097.1 metalloregulator ArsR/SmtB family transcription factor [Arachnia sp.]